MLHPVMNRYLVIADFSFLAGGQDSVFGPCKMPAGCACYELIFNVLATESSG